MEKYRNEYIDFLVKVRGYSHEYIENSTIYINKFLKFMQEKGINDINLVDREYINDYQDMIMKEDYAVTTKHQSLAIVYLFFKYLNDYGHIKDNPALVIDIPRRGHQIPKNIMNEEEIKYLLTLPNTDDLLGMRDYCIMNLLYSSAMRPKEAFNLKMDDLDVKRCQAVVRRPKNRRDRIVHFDRYTAHYLKKYIVKARPWLLKGRESDRLFIGAAGSDLMKASWAVHFANRYKGKMEKNFRKHITPYCFRHTSATHWLDSGAKQKRDVLPYIQRQLGHESLESTVIYTHVAIEPLRQMFKQYHPREISLKALHRIPSPDDIISKIKDDDEGEASTQPA